MKQYWKSILCVILSLLCMVSVVSCNFGKQDASESSNSEVTEANGVGGDATDPTETEEEFDPKQAYKPANKQYDRDFTFAANEYIDYFTVDEKYQSGKGTVLQEAAFKRNLVMSEIHGVNVNIKNVSLDTLSVTALVGQHVADVAIYGTQQLFNYVTKGLYADVLEFNGLNLSAPYWDQNIQEQFMIGDALYVIEGDFSFVDQIRTGVFLYNADVYNARGYDTTYGSPYALVDSGAWTFDLMFEMADGMYVDENRNGIEDENDTYGILCGTGLVWAFFGGSGMKLMASKHGEIELLISDPTYWENAYSAIEKIVGKCIQNDDVANPKLWNHDNIWAAASTAFESGRVLYRYTALSAALRLTNSDCTFGLLPVPKFTQDQEQYHTIVSPAGSLHGTMLSSIPDGEVAAEIFDAICYYSRYGGAASLYDAYFETFRLNKFCGTPNDLRMLELLFSTTFYDLDYAANITQLPSNYIYHIEMDEDASSLYSTLYNARNAAQTRLEEYKLEIASLKS